MVATAMMALVTMAAMVTTTIIKKDEVEGRKARCA
jgi:hypothetical protein